MLDVLTTMHDGFRPLTVMIEIFLEIRNTSGFIECKRSKVFVFMKFSLKMQLRMRFDKSGTIQVATNHWNIATGLLHTDKTFLSGQYFIIRTEDGRFITYTDLSAVRIAIKHTSQCDVHIRCLCFMIEFFHGSRTDGIIAIHKGQVFSLGFCQACISCMGYSLMFRQTNDTNTKVGCCILFGNGGCTVG